MAKRGMGGLLVVGALAAGAYFLFRGSPGTQQSAPAGTPVTRPAEKFKQKFGKAVDEVVKAHAASGGFVATADGIFRPATGGRLLTLERPQVDESQTSASRNKDIVIQNPITGQWETVRNVFRQSLRPAGVQTAELGSGGGQLSLESIKKLASRKGSAFQKSASSGKIRRGAPAGSASSRSANSGGSIRRSSI